MRKIVAGLFVSLDGVAEAPNRFVFPYFDEGVGQAVGAGMEAADTVLLGRKTYEEWAAYWPGKTAADDPFADYINNTPKVVISTTLKSADWPGTTLIRSNVAEELARLKQQPGKGIGISGSGTLVRSLLRDGLLDELDLLVFPIVVGSGQRLFQDLTEQIPLKLVGSQTYGKGVVSLRYAPEGK